jgi:hypothetical protein
MKDAKWRRDARLQSRGSHDRGQSGRPGWVEWLGSLCCPRRHRCAAKDAKRPGRSGSEPAVAAAFE